MSTIQYNTYIADCIIHRRCRRRRRQHLARQQHSVVRQSVKKTVLI